MKNLIKTKKVIPLINTQELNTIIMLYGNTLLYDVPIIDGGGVDGIP